MALKVRLRLTVFLVALLFPCSLSYAGTDFYTLAERWDKANGTSVTRKDAVDQSFTSALQQSAPSLAPSIPAPISLTQSLNDLSSGQRVFEIQQNQSLFVKAKEAVSKFVSTEEEKVSIETVDSNTLRILGTGVGTTFIHIWTVSEGRHTFQLQVVPQKFSPSSSQVKQQEALEKSRTFKIGYDNARNAFYTGPTYRTKIRSSLDFTQNFTLEGDTPYGALSSHAQTENAAGKNLLTDGQVALKNGKLGPLKNFNAEIGDVRVEPNLMAFPGARVRGGAVEQWDDNKKKYQWDTFYGREQASIIGTLTPGLVTKRTINSNLGGGFVDYVVNDNAKIDAGLFTGAGNSRSDDLHRYGTGLKSDISLGPHLAFRPEADYDSEHYAQKEALFVKFDNFRLRGEYRNITKGFETLTGPPGEQGELGYVLDGNATLAKNVVLSGSTDIFRDRLIPNPEDLRAYNVHNDLSLSVTPWEGSSLLMTYQGIDDTGRLGPLRQTSYGAQFNQRVNFFGRRGNIFTRFTDRENVILNNSVLDYHVDQVSLGYSMPIFWNINFSITQQVNYLNEYNIPESSIPRALVYSLDYSGRITDTPLYTDMHFQYTDEENTESTNSFMSGFDTTEFTASLFYREYENMEIFLTGTIQNYRPESSNITDPRVEAQFLTGVKYLLDTKYRWSAVGSFNGYVYKDLNGDGQRQANEPGIEGMTIQSSDNRHTVTDKNGYYELKSVVGNQTTLTLDISKIPYGYVPTSPARLQLPIAQGTARRADFGVTPRSEITGIVFNDLDGDGKYDVASDKGIKRVRIKLENGAIARANALGVYSFSDVIAGEHTVSIDMSTLPEGYLPEGIPRQTVTVFEGIRFELNFPLQAVRTITGRVFVDANANRRMDSEEKPLAGVQVQLAGQTVTTDKDGWYLFDSLPKGSYTLSVAENTLPSGLTKPAAVKIELPSDPITITNADIAIPAKPTPAPDVSTPKSSADDPKSEKSPE